MNYTKNAQMIPNLNGPFYLKGSLTMVFGVCEGTKDKIKYWIDQFHQLRETIKIDKWSGFLNLCWIYGFGLIQELEK